MDISKIQQRALRYNRKLILNIFESAFHKVYEMSQMKRETSNQEFKYYSYNFKQHFTCLMEYVIPSL